MTTTDINYTVSYRFTSGAAHVATFATFQWAWDTFRMLSRSPVVAHIVFTPAKGI